MAQKARRDRRPPSQVVAADADPVADAESFGSDLPIGSGMETAPIGEVTSAMMDEAAHRAAEAVEAAVDPSVTHAGPVGEEHPAASSSPPMDLVVRPPVGDETATRDAEPSSEGETGEAEPMAAVTSPPAEGVLAPAPVGGAAATLDAEMAAVGQPSGLLVVETPPRVDELEASAAEPADEAPRLDLASPGEAIGAYGAQVVAMLAANVAASSHFVAELMSATSVTDVMAVNTSHLRRQMELIATQRRQWATLARTLAFDAMRPFSLVQTDHGRDR